MSDRISYLCIKTDLGKITCYNKKKIIKIDYSDLDCTIYTTSGIDLYTKLYDPIAYKKIINFIN